MKRGPGRPSKFTPELADRIVEQLSHLSMRKVCEAPEMPERQAIEHWRLQDAAFHARCARAIELRADYLADGMEDIEDKVETGDMDPAAGRVILSSQQWRLSKLWPKRYGERTVLAGDPEAPVSVSVDMTGLSAADLRALAKVKLPDGDV